MQQRVAVSGFRFQRVRERMAEIEQRAREARRRNARRQVDGDARAHAGPDGREVATNEERIAGARERVDAAVGSAEIRVDALRAHRSVAERQREQQRGAGARRGRVRQSGTGHGTPSGRR